VSDPMRTGYEAYTTHSQCALLNGYAPAHAIDAATAIKFHLPPEEQDMIQMARPHSTDRVQWMRGWDRARADEAAGKVSDWEEA
jgi:hypothetical protein